MSAPPPISPDGAYWWDGQSWQPIPHDGPIPPPGVPVVEPAPPPWAPGASTAVAKTRPPASRTTSWLPDDMEEIPAIVPLQRPPKIVETSPPVGTVPPPVWVPGKRTAAARRILSTVALVVVVLLVIAGGAWALQSYGLARLAALLPAHRTSAAVATPSPVTSPSPTIIQPLTAHITGTACGGAHVGDATCWTVSFTNTGPAVSNLAMIFVTDPPYSNWFEHHFGAAMASTDNAAGCSVDSIHLQVVCGQVAANAHITIHLTGYMANVGTHNYGVRFADIASGTINDVNLGSDGTPFVLQWTESVS